MNTDSTTTATADTDTPTPTPTPAPSKIRTRSAQPRALSNDITAAAQLLGAVNSNPDIVAALAPAGYPQAEITAGQQLQVVAQTAYGSRQAAAGKASLAKTARMAAELKARRTFSDYRKVVQADYPKATDRKALGAGGPFPEDLQVFVTTARAAFSAAKQAPYASALAKRGYSTSRLSTAVADLDALDTAESAYLTAAGIATDTLRVRDQAAHELATWIGKFRRIASVVLRDQPEMREKLGL